MIEETQAAPDDLEEQIKQELAKESATLETGTEVNEVDTPQAVDEIDLNNGSEYVPTESEKVQARINKKHFEMMEAKREAESLRQQLQEAQARPKPVEAVTGDEPTLDQFKEEDFGYDDTARLAAYTSALTTHRIEKTLATREGMIAERQKQFEQQTRQAELTNKYLSEAAEYSAKNPSYLTDVSKLPQLSMDKLDLLRSQGAKVVHYLSRNPEIANQFAQGDFGSSAVQLGMISAQLNNNKKPTQSSKAPSPVETVSGNAGAMTKDISEMSMEELMRI